MKPALEDKKRDHLERRRSHQRRRGAAASNGAL